MNICILTQPLGINYGCALQAYALQKVLGEMGHNVTTLRWFPLTHKNPVKTLQRFASKYIKGNKDIVYLDYEKQLHYTFKELERFIEEHINCTVATAPLVKGDIPGFDAYVVGSDQVWRPMYSANITNFYLDFLGDSPAKRIAYAASFGVDVWEADEKTTKKIRPLARRFDVISVREESGVRLCEQFLGVEASVMPDPTLLLTAEDYLSISGLKQPEREGYIAAYILDRSEKKLRFINRMSEQMNLPVRFVGQLDWVNGVDSMESWIERIAKASYVLTDSFHGTVFSLLFEKKFLSISNSARGGSRFESLLNAVGLRERLIDSSQFDAFIPAFPEEGFQTSREVIQEMRQKGRAFLKVALSEQ